MMTAGWFAFDENTRAELRKVMARPLDKFGEPIEIANPDWRIVAAVREKPMRGVQLAAKLGSRRWFIELMCATLIMQDVIERDDEAFYTLKQAA